MWVSVAIEDETVRIEVVSSGTFFDLAARLEAVPSDTGGRGLQIVRMLSKTLVVEYASQRCHVIATLPL